MTTITSKGYKLIAKSLRDAKPPLENYPALKQWNITVECIAYDLAKDNPKFNPSVFYKATGYNGKE